MLSGHKGAVLDLHFSADGDLIFSASSDKSIMIWDSHTGARIKKLAAHQSIVNCCHPSRRSQLLCSAGDDCNVRLWDVRKRGLVSYYKDNYQITGITFNDSSDQIIFAGIDNVLKVYDLRKNDILYTMSGHFDTVTGLALSPDGSYVLSNSMDNSRKTMIGITALITMIIICRLHSSLHLGHPSVRTAGPMHQNPNRSSAQL